MLELLSTCIRRAHHLGKTVRSAHLRKRAFTTIITKATNNWTLATWTFLFFGTQNNFDCHMPVIYVSVSMLNYKNSPVMTSNIHQKEIFFNIMQELRLSFHMVLKNLFNQFLGSFHRDNKQDSNNQKGFSSLTKKRRQVR